MIPLSIVPQLLSISTRVVLVCVATTSLFLSGCTDRSKDVVSDLEFRPTRFATEEGDSLSGEFGLLSVPERHERLSGAMIQLAVARFPSTSDNPGSPILYLAGGTGAAGIHPERMPLFRELLSVADVITFDQRGTGQSIPELSCPKQAELQEDGPGTRKALFTLHFDIAKNCARYLRNYGVDLSAYNVSQSVEDIEYLRLALGIDRFHIVGVSFGSHLALATLRTRPGTIDHVLLAGVEGLHQTFKLPSNLDLHLATVSKFLANEPGVGALLPDLEKFVEETLDDLRQNGPKTIHRLDGSTTTMTAFQFSSFVAGTIVRSQFLRFAPADFAPMVQGDFSGWQGGRRRARAFGMRAAMDCASNWSHDRRNRVMAERESSSLGSTMDFPYPDVCSAWDVADLGEEFRQSFSYSGPVQFVSGSLDGLTPPSNVDEIRVGFSNSGHILVDRVGHEGPQLWFGSAALMPIIRRFLSGATPQDTTLFGHTIEWVMP